MIETVNPYLCKDAPIWWAYRRDINDCNSAEETIEHVTLVEAREFVETYLNEHYPYGWELEQSEEDGWDGYYYGTGAFGRLRPAQINIMPEYGRVWWRIQGREMIRQERIRDKSTEMYTLLRDLAPNDPRVLAIMGYVEEYSLI